MTYLTGCLLLGASFPPITFLSSSPTTPLFVYIHPASLSGLGTLLPLAFMPAVLSLQGALPPDPHMAHSLPSLKSLLTKSPP